MNTNVLGWIRLTQMALPYIRVSHGRLIFMSSVAATINPFGAGPYSISKNAIRSLATTLRHELFDSNVAVSIMSTGCVKTPIFAQSSFDHSEFAGEKATNYNMIYQAAKFRLGDLCAEMAPFPNVSSTPDIVHAITSPYPRTDYFHGFYFGMPVRMVNLVEQFLPARLMDLYMGKLAMPAVRLQYWWWEP